MEQHLGMGTVLFRLSKEPQLVARQTWGLLVQCVQLLSQMVLLSVATLCHGMILILCLVLADRAPFSVVPPDGDDVSGVASLQNVIQSDPH